MSKSKVFPGGKNCCFQRIINLIPPHDTYIETHLDSGAVMRNKLPAASNIGIDVDLDVLSKFDLPTGYKVDLICTDAIGFLQEHWFPCHTFIYADPPYLNGVRTKRKQYRHEYSDKQHVELLETLRRLASSPLINVMISGYWSELYADMLSEWHVHSFEAMTRGGMRREFLWMSYPPPDRLHDYRYIGDTFRDRERIRRRQRRWIANLKRMPALERRALMERIRNEV